MVIPLSSAHCSIIVQFLQQLISNIFNLYIIKITNFILIIIIVLILLKNITLVFQNFLPGAFGLCQCATGELLEVQSPTFASEGVTSGLSSKSDHETKRHVLFAEESFYHVFATAHLGKNDPNPFLKGWIDVKVLYDLG
jgi:hypothetical protein